jgi:hypothetical protein
MISFLHRRRSAVLVATTFCDSYAKVCTPAGRAKARHDAVRTRAFAAGVR